MKQHLIDLADYSVSQQLRIVDLAGEIQKHPGWYSDSCHGKVMGTMFFEPSTRTQLSFQTAMLRLGGQVIGFENPLNTSVAKGESLKDTVRIVSTYADLCVMRHPQEGSVWAASLYSNCPMVNAGDGGHLHPTQTLTDLVTLKQYKGRLDNLTIGLCGDLKNGRTVHSLIRAMSRFPGNRFVLISTPLLSVPDYIKEELRQSQCPYEEAATLEEAMAGLDVLYMTRIQRERFASEEAYQREKDVYVLDRKKLGLSKPDLAVLHPLPRVDEITDQVDDDPRAVYFQQAKCGMYARMALILTMLETPYQQQPAPYSPAPRVCCNPRCVTSSEGYLPPLTLENQKGQRVCGYCEQALSGEEGR